MYWIDACMVVLICVIDLKWKVMDKSVNYMDLIHCDKGTKCLQVSM